MKNITRKLVALLLVMSMAVSMAMPTVFAAAPAETAGAAEAVEIFSDELLAAAPEFAAAKLATLTTLSQDTVESAILTGMLNGETVIDVADYAASEEEAGEAAEAILDEVNASEMVDASVVAGEDGEAATVVLDIDPRTANVIELLNELPAYTNGITTAAEGDSDLVGISAEEKEMLLGAYLQLVGFKEQYADLFGVDVPFNTYKNSESNPFASLLALTYIYYDPTVREDENGFEYAGFYRLNMLGGGMGGDFVNVTLDDGTVQERQYMDAFSLYIMLTAYHLSNVFGVTYFGEEIAEDAAGFLTELQQAKQAAGSKGISDAEEALLLTDYICKHADLDIDYLYLASGAAPAEEPVEDPVIARATKDLKDAMADQMGGMVFPDEILGYLVEGIVNMWKTNHIGALGRGSGLCISYVNAYNYLLQMAHPEIYRNADGTWKSYKDVNYKVSTKNGKTVYTESTDAPYIVDTCDSQIIVFGLNYGQYAAVPVVSDHYWNAVKIKKDGGKAQWYYTDPNYIDSYYVSLPCTRGTPAGMELNDLFLISDKDIKNYFGVDHFKSLDSLYQEIAVDSSLSHAWFSYIRGTVSTGADGFYYAYDTSDALNDLYAADPLKTLEQEPDFGIARRSFGLKDTDKTMTKLIDFQTAAKGGTKVLNPVNGKMEVSEELTTLFEQFLNEREKINDFQISGNLYGDLYLFNLSNCIMSYNIVTGEVTRLKEYNTVSAARNKSVVCMDNAFDVVPNGSKNAAVTVENHPLTAMEIVGDTLATSVATTLSGASTPGWRHYFDSFAFGIPKIGYLYEETNYQRKYMNLDHQVEKNPALAPYRMANDNGEFDTAHLKDNISLTELLGDKHNYVKVSVDATCGRNAFTEERCKDCGAIKAGTRVEKPGTALDHHFITFHETYYTTTDFHHVLKTENPYDSQWNTGVCYVCTRCMDAIDEADWEKSGYKADEHIYKDYRVEWSKDNKSAKAVVDGCEVCSKAKLDCTVGLDTSDSADCEVTSKTEGLKTTYTATVNGVVVGTKVVTKELSVSISSTSKTYTGKAVKPGTVTVKCAGATLKEGKDYTVSYKNNVKVGTATVVVTGKGTYAGLKATKDFRVNPKTVKVSSLKSAKKGQLTVKWAKNASVTGYQVKYGKKSDLSDGKTVTVKSAKTLTKTLTGLTAGKKYYVSVRTYQKVGGKTYYSAWSAKQSATVKK